MTIGPPPLETISIKTPDAVNIERLVKGHLIMIDAPLTSIQPTPASSTPEFKTGQHVEVDNLDEHGLPGPFHACRGEIRMLFREDGHVAAKVEFSNGVQRKMFVTKLIPVPVKQKPVRTPPAAPTPAPKLPLWAKKHYIMVRGDQLQPLDLVYFTKYANPRQLKRWLDDRTWSGDIIINWYGFDKPIEQGKPISITPDRWYVVERK